MASKRHGKPQLEEPQAKRARYLSDCPEKKTKHRVVLNPADCDLDFNIDANGLQGHGHYEQGFAYCWSGARANIGIKAGKYCFGCKIISGQPVDMEDTPSEQRHVCRIGISRGNVPIRNLGETKHSFGFGGTGKFSNECRFTNYGEPFGVGDTIVCSVDLENKTRACISFFKNGKWLGIATYFDPASMGLEEGSSPVQWESGIFPHILLKNVVVEVMFSIEDGLVLEEGFKPWSSALMDGNAIIGPTFSNFRDCEVFMMVGLPASGKTTWAEKWVNEHPEKRYVLLGTNLALDQMKVPGLARKHNYGERFERLMDRATGIFNTLLAMASRIPRNYIIDQTNVFKNARKRKLKPFANFHKIAVVVFPKPEELKLRSEKRFKEMGKDVPAEAVNNMLANYVLPKSKDMNGTDEYFDQVVFVELNRGESQRYLDEMKSALRSISNLSSNRESSPFSRGSPVQSFTSHPPENQGGLAVYEANWQSLQSSVPLSNNRYQMPLQVSSSYTGVVPRDDSYRATYRTYGRVPLQTSDSHYSGREGIKQHDIQSSRNYIETVYPFESPAGSVRSSLSFPYSYAGHTDPVPLQFNHKTQGEPMSMHGPSPSLYDSPSETPIPRPLYGSFPTTLRQTGGNAPTHPSSPFGTPSARPSHGNFPTNIQWSGAYAPTRPSNY